jgi:hypothetical protein
MAGGFAGSIVFYGDGSGEHQKREYVKDASESQLI